MINDQSSLPYRQRPTSNLQPPTSKWRRLRWAMPIFMLFTALIVPFRDIAPTYALPQLITAQQLPANLKRLDVDYGEQLRLVGYQTAVPSAPSAAVEFTLYWQCLKPMAADYSVFVIVYGRQLQAVGKRDAYPYHGLYATRQCQAGQILADPYRIPIAAEADRPTVLRAQIGVKDWVTATELTPNADGAPLPAVIVPVGKLAGELLVARDNRLNYRVGEHLRLLDASIKQNDHGSSLTLRWQATGTPPEDYTTFVHILDANGKLIGQADGPALNGDYPTSWWSPNEIVIDERPLPLPPGADRVTIGLYRLADGARLPILDQNGQRVANDEIVLPVQP